MPHLLVTRDEPRHNPLDLVEEIVAAHDWAFDRNDDEIFVEIPGKWSDYRLYFSWNEEMSVLQFSSAIALKVPRERRAAVNELLALTNEKMWLGHFDIASDEGLPLFRHAIPLRGMSGASVELIEDLVDIALNECERFYPALQYVVWAGKSPSEAVAAACLETVGEA